MRVLWLSLSSSLYKISENGYNGIGWIASLEQHIKLEASVSLGIAFYLNDIENKIINDGVTYYPINRSKKITERVRRFFISHKSDNSDMIQIKRVINDFQPDIIHIFGTETNFGKIIPFTNIPVTIHIQGILNPYVNAWFPAGFSFFDFIIYNGFNLKKSIVDAWMYDANKKMAIRELQILKDCRYFMGRTEWDKNVTKLLSPNSKYLYCSEILREVFYQSNYIPVLKNSSKFIIQSTISSPLYKGVDLILKTAKLLCTQTKIQFEWHIFGVKEISFFEKKLNIKHCDVNVKLMGIATAQDLKDNLSNCDLYVHPSYIDNSPNSVCEAQILGIPVIVTNVGGLSSLVVHNETGLIIPANDPYSLVYYIDYLRINKEHSKKIGQNGKVVALERHKTATIISNLLTNYQIIIDDNNQKFTNGL